MLVLEAAGRSIVDRIAGKIAVAVGLPEQGPKRAVIFRVGKGQGVEDGFSGFEDVVHGWLAMQMWLW